MTVPSPREHDRDERDVPAAEAATDPAPVRYTYTSIYVAVMVTVILLAILFDWRL